jgi:hypothetical protein
LQQIGEKPTGWVMNPVDAQAIDLPRWGSSGGFLTDGYETDSDQMFGNSDNIFGGTTPRVVSPSVPAGTAILGLGDWRQAEVFVHQSMTILANAFGDSLFQSNAVQLRGEILAGVSALRPRAFAVVGLTA